MTHFPVPGVAGDGAPGSLVVVPGGWVPGGKGWYRMGRVGYGAKVGRVGT